MYKFNRRTFLKLLGQGTAVLGMGLSGRAWTKTGTSLITFGFAVYKFFQFEAASLPDKEGIIKTAILGPREFGIILIGIGILSLLIGSIEHARDLRVLRKDYPEMPFSGTRLIALLTATLGAVALIAVIYRF